jgi:hypothetical protein
MSNLNKNKNGLFYLQYSMHLTNTYFIPFTFWKVIPVCAMSLQENLKTSIRHLKPKS